VSKILKAMQKASGTGESFEFRLATADQVNLFPPPVSQQMAEFEQLTNSLISYHDGVTGQVAVFASAVSGEGTSFVSYNVARHMSVMLDRKVAWIDGNFRSPQKRLHEEGINFRQLLEYPDCFMDMVISGNLTLIPNGHQKIKTTDLISSDNYGKLIDYLRDNFYFTIIDAPPILESVDVAHMTAGTLGLVLVVESRRLKYEVIQHGIDILETHKVNVLGAVLNKRTFDIPKFLYNRL
jgi:Mrp family chromosome partitioning ATPase